MTIKEVRELLEEEFKIIGNCVTEKSLNQFKKGFFWNNLEEFLSDAEVLISPDEMVKKYFSGMLETIKNYDGDLTKDVVNNEFLQLWADDDIYVDIESIKNSFSYNEEL